MALSGTTLRYLFGTLSSEMFWSCASWGCNHQCHFLLVFSFYLCSWNSPSGGKGSNFCKQNQHHALSWSNTTKQEVAISPTTVSNISVLASNTAFPGTLKNTSCALTPRAQWFCSSKTVLPFLLCLSQERGGMRENSVWTQVESKLNYNFHGSFLRWKRMMMKLG